MTEPTFDELVEEFRLELKEKRKKPMELLTSKELAKTLKVGLPWVYKQTAKKGEGSIPRLKMGRYLRFRMDDVMAWIESQSQQSN